MEMEEAEAMDKPWLVGRRGETPNSVVAVYVYGDDRKLYSLTPNRNGDDAQLIGTQIPDQPKHGAREP